ncbi:Bug family tripartite tricarboxylate transporter substrate binding protein [Bordetella bronchiseptica]|uniref:Bug family tripartite tricarboxylate transporter substrate binding protein n=1 Tax=Bordetella bronchiseptica TaxID=518 RepID=UPI0005006A83|nr:tripartite tricarboxylate transporter substrate binding protein [Bordetella bronchiseptica]KFJ53467.1 tripartite tricarboxylate transporter receptor family protein [Bordetella bronchiseptica]MCE7074138.1 hypothetical protein [Bordetella bronchiseptica]RFT72782.1 tripartite tricarboxylate transporter substrate binding protein [Bordetella bronchiseptica]SUV62221.1 Argininosuccinate lyase [Bordetella bronchiseptica]
MYRIVSALAVSVTCLAGMGAAQADQGAAAYPGKPIKIVIPYSAGGGTDQFMRIVSERASRVLGQPITILNKPGGSTVIGVNAVIGAAPDGYTLLVSTNTSYTLIPYVMSPPPYAPEKSLDYVATLGQTSMVLTANKTMPSDLKTVLDSARQSPGRYTYATYGVGSSTHLAGEVFMNDTGVEFRHIPYKGVEAVTALAGNQVDLMIDGINAAGTMLDAGKTQALVVLQRTRSQFLPDTPTLVEAGYPEAAENVISYVMAAPKGTPAAVIDKLQKSFAEALRDPGVLAQAKAMRTEAAFKGPAQTQAFVDSQSALFKDIVAKKNIKF